MKKILLVSLMLVSIPSFANEAKKVSHKNEVSKNVPPQVQAKEKSEVPCATTQEQIMKELEEKKKAQQASGKAPSLQGLGSTGCKVK
jgi:hypothetical protein